MATPTNGMENHFDVTAQINQMQSGAANTLAISLSCFDQAKLDFSKLSGPLTIASTGPQALSIIGASLGASPMSGVTRVYCP